jgi:glyoxylase-like metal-dependent hydrolase (beta-lactamase superfamily II)/MFS family permease
MTGPRRGALAALGLAALSFSLVQTAMLPALPELQREFGTDPEGVAWVVTAFLVTAALITPIVGRLGDMFGKRRVLLLGLAVLAVGCLVSAVGSSLAVVVGGRFLAGLGGGGVLPLCFGLAREALPAERVGSGIGLVSATVGVGGGFGLLLGGVAIDAASYRWIFLTAAAVAALAAIAIALVIRESPERRRGRVDVRGAVVLGVGLAVPLVAISEATTWGWSWRMLGLLAAGLAILGAWVKLEQRTPEPLIDISMLARPSVLMTNVATLLVGFGMLGAFVLTPQLAQASTGTGYGLGLGATAAGLIMIPGAIGMLVLGPVSGALGGWVGNKVPLAAGGVLTAVGLLLLAAEHDSVAALVGFGFVALAGVGLAFAAMPNLIVEAVPLGQTGEATGINSLMRLVGGALGSQVTAAVLAGSAVAGSRVPQGSGYTTAFLIGAGGALVAAVAAVLVPGSGGRRHLRALEQIGAAALLQVGASRASDQQRVQLIGGAPEQVHDGVWLVRLPVPHKDLESVFAYLLETEEGLVLVDAGYDRDEGWEVLTDAIRSAPEEVVCVLLTHLHPDHVGLAGRVRDASGAWIGAHVLEARNEVVWRRAMSADGAARALRLSGMPDGESHAIAAVVAANVPPTSTPQLDRCLYDGEEIVVGERRLRVVWTPGHAPGHLVFHDHPSGVVFAGDLLLPRTTPHIGADPTNAKNPLGDFLESVGRLGDLRPSLVLPGHEWVYRDAVARAAELVAHHEERLDEVAAIMGGEPLTTWEVTQRMRWSRSLDADGFAAFAAAGEAAAHLRLLEVRGDVARDATSTGVVLWSRGPGLRGA